MISSSTLIPLLIGTIEEAQVDPIVCTFEPWWHTPLRFGAAGLALMAIIVPLILESRRNLR